MTILFSPLPNKHPTLVGQFTLPPEHPPKLESVKFLVDVSDIFSFFFLFGGGGKGGGVRGGGRGGSVLIKNRGRGGGFRGGGVGGGRALGECLWGGEGGGGKYFFSGPKFPPRVDLHGRIQGDFKHMS